MIDTKELRFSAANSVRDLALLPSEVLELLGRLKAAEKRTAKLEERCATLTGALRLAVRQNSHDMLMTAEELRWCEAILEETK